MGLEPGDKAHDEVKEAAAKATSNVPRHRRKVRGRGRPLLTFSNVPDYLQDNEYIVTGYRSNMPFKDTIKSLFGIHNETGNVWTHLLGFLLFAVFTIYVMNKPPAPLAIGQQHAETLWESVKDNLQHISDAVGKTLHDLHENIGHNLHSLQDSFHTTPGGLHSDQAQIRDSLGGDATLPLPSSSPEFLGNTGGNAGVFHDVASGVEHPETMWSAVMDNLHQISASVGKQLHSLQDNIEHNLHSLQEGFQLKVHSVQDGIVLLQKLQHDLLHSIGDNLHSSVQSLQDGLQSQAHALQVLIEEKLDLHLADVLGPVLQYPVSRWPAYVFMAGAMICLLTSSVCHLFSCCSRHVVQIIWRFDYAAISVLIVTSFYPPVYYGFLCMPFWRNLYLISITALGSVTVAVSLLPWFQGVRFRTFRASLYAGLGLFGIVPIYHLSLLYPTVWHIRQAIYRDLLMGFLYLLGATIYSQRVPERWGPGKFDVAFHSHQIFHTCVVLAAMVHFSVVLLLLEWRDASGGCASPVTAGPVSEVVRSMKEGGHDLLALEQVWDSVRSFMMGHMGIVPRSTAAA